MDQSAEPSHENGTPKQPDRPQSDQEPDKGGAKASDDTKDEEGGKGGVKANIENLTSGVANFAGQQEFKYFFYGKDTLDKKPFSSQHTTLIPFEDESDIAEYYVGKQDFIQELYSRICERRLLILTGGPETGKTATAIYLSHLLRKSIDQFGGAYLVRSLDQSVKMDWDVVRKRDAFSNRMLLFKDAFAGGNRDIMEFFRQMSKPFLKEVTEDLRAQQTFIVFTAESHTAGNCHKQLYSLDIEHPLEQLSSDLLMDGLSLRLKRFARYNGQDPKEVEDYLNQEQREYVIRALQTMPRIAQLIDNDLLKIRKGMDLREAVSRANNLKYWFLSDLTDSFDVWCFALTLALCQPLPYSSGVPWIEFEFFYKRISDCLREELGLSQKERDDFKHSISEEHFLNKCRAEIYKDPNTAVDFVRFTNDRYPEMLWDVFLKYNRKALTALLPEFRNLTEATDPYIRARASQIIGRVGEIDPIRLTQSFVDEWIISGRIIRWASVGYLYQGVFASQNDHYREELFKKLAYLAAEEEKPEVWTAIATYKQIGLYDLPLAMNKFKEIAERKFAGTIENTDRLDRIFNRIEKALEDRALPLDAIDRMAIELYHNYLSEIARRMFQQDSALLLAIQYAIVSLCITVDTIQVIEELQKWMDTDKRSLGALTALIFLQRDGIAEELETRTIEIEVGRDRQTHQCNLLVVSIASNENSIRQLAKFLEVVFDSFFTFFHLRSKRYFTKSFFLHLKNWSENSLPVERIRNAMRDLLAFLFLSSNKNLRAQLHNFLENDADFTDESTKLYLFKRDVRRRVMDLKSQGVSL